METIVEIKELIESISTDYKKVKAGNHAASIRARKNAQHLKTLIPKFRKDVSDELKKHKNDDGN